MTTLTLNIPESLADQIAHTDPQKIVEVIQTGLSEQATEHPYITRVPGILSGRPIIRGSRIPVWQVAEAIIHRGETVENYVADHPHLTPAKIHDAMSYYFDHRDEIEKEIAENQTANVAQVMNMTVDERGFAHFSETSSQL